jgi:hypothetical protein
MNLRFENWRGKKIATIITAATPARSHAVVARRATASELCTYRVPATVVAGTTITQIAIGMLITPPAGGITNGAAVDKIFLESI